MTSPSPSAKSARSTARTRSSNTRARDVCVPEKNPISRSSGFLGNETSHDEGVSAMNANRNTGMFIDTLALVVNGSDYSDVKDRNIEHTAETYPVPGGG